MPMRGHGNVTGADVIMRWHDRLSRSASTCQPRLSALQPGRVLDRRPAGPRRLRRGVHPRRRPRRDDAAAGDRPPDAHPDDRARPEGDAHQPAGPRPHHDGRHRASARRARLSHGRDPAAAAAGAEVAVPDRRGSRPPDQRGDRREAAWCPTREPPSSRQTDERSPDGTELRRQTSMLRITGGKVYDPANGIDGEVKDVCIDDGRIVADGRGRPHDRRHGHDRLSRRRRRSHARRRRRAQLRPRR